MRTRKNTYVVSLSLILIFLLIITSISVLFFISPGVGSKSTLVTVSGTGQNDYFGWNVSSAGDINGDGFEDIIVGAPGYDNDRGRAYIFFGGPWFTGALSADDANVTITGIAQGDRFGWDVSSAGNMNDDIFDDIIVGAPGYNGDAGGAYIFFGNNLMPSLIDANDANVVIVSGNGGDVFGSSVSSAKDVNNDGYDDVIVGSPGNNTNTGAAYIFYGAQFTSGLIDVKDANVSMFGEGVGDKIGFSVSSAGDVNKDNYDDVIIGAPGSDRVYIYCGGDPMNAWFQTTQAEFDDGAKVHLRTESTVEGEVKLETFNNIKAMMTFYNGIATYTPRIRTWDQTAWGPWSDAGGAGTDENQWFVIKSGTVRKNEKILAVSDNGLDINVQIFDGLSWSLVLELVDVLVNSDYRGFDLAYESQSGEAMLVYYNSSSGNKFPKYRIWNGTFWSAEQDAVSVGTDDVYWVVLASNPNSDEILMVTLNSTNGIWAQVWDGDVWGNVQLIETAASQIMYQCFDAVYESQSGYGFIAWADNMANLKYRRWKGDWAELEGSWGTAIGAVRFVKMAPEPNTNYILVAQLDDSSEIDARVWDGLSWGTTKQLTTNSKTIDRRCFDVAWEPRSDREGLVVYGEGDDAPMFRNVSGSTISDTELTAVDANPGGTGDPNWITLENDPQSDDIMMMYLVYDGLGAVDDIGVELWNGTGWEKDQNVETDSTRDNATRFDLAYTDTSGYLISTPYDSKTIAPWGRIRWTADEPLGTTIKIRTRTSPDNTTWSPWSGWYNNGDRITSPDNRFIQYQAWFETMNVTLTPTLYDITIELSHADLIINGTSGEGFGWAVAGAGDLDNDGRQDVIIGAPQNNSGQGSAYIFNGRYMAAESKADRYINLPNGDTANVTMTGESSGDLFGYSVSSAGNFTPDGYRDVIVGAPNAGSNGTIYLFFGSPSMAPNIPATNSDFTLLGENALDGYGQSVSWAGNVDDDPIGYEEVIVSSPYFDEGININSGKVYVIHLYHQPDLWINGSLENVYQDVPNGPQVNLTYINAGNNATWWIKAQNDGDLEDTFDFNIAPTMLTNWTWEMRENATWNKVNDGDSITLSVGELVDLTLNISSPNTAVNCDESWVTLTLISQNDTSKKDSIKAVARAMDIIPPVIMDTSSGMPTTGDLFNVTATISDNIALDKMYLYYWFNTTTGPTAAQNVTMNDLGGGDFNYLISVPSNALLLHYNISANDTSCNWNETCEKTLDVEDNDPPRISDISANPSTQEVGGEVNITVSIIDNIGINEVWVEITYPSGSKTNNSMNKTGGNNWYHNNIYTELGSYNYTLWINDTSDNSNVSALYQFEITPPVDFIRIRSMPNGEGEVVSAIIINVGNTIRIYASAYNNAIGYLCDVEVDWWSSNPSAGTVNPARGSSTNFTGIALGTGDLYATFGLLNHEATFEVVISQEPVINGIILNIELPEDFGLHRIYLTQYASDPQDDLSDLRWRLTGVNTSVIIIKNETQYGEHIIPFVSRNDRYGNMEITYWLVDSQGNQVYQKAWINVSPVNDPPKITDCPNLVVHFDSPYAFDYAPYIHDVDNPLSELILTCDDTAYATVNGFVVTYNYPKSMLGEKFITLTISDGLGNGSDLIEITITSNHPPVSVARIPDVTLYENETKLAVLDLDDYFVDPDGDSLTMSIRFTQLNITINENHTVDFSALGEWSGTEMVTFRAKDPMGAIVEQTINVTVLNINDPPVIKSLPQLSVRYNRSYSFDLRWYISDEDNEIEDLVISTSNPDNVTVVGTQIILLYPKDWESQSYPYDVTLTIYVSDGISTTSQNIIVNVSANFPPEMFVSLDDLFLFEDENLIGVYDLDNYFFDWDGDPIFYTYGNEYINVTIHDDHTIDFLPLPNWFGSELIVIRATDDKGAFFEDMIKVTVLPVNDPPFIADIPTQEGIKGQEWILDLTDYISDIDSQLINLNVSVNSTYVEVVGHVLIFHYPDNISEDTIWITVSDGENETTASVGVIIKPPPAAPEEAPWIFYILTIILAAILMAILLLYRGIYTVEDLFLITRSGLLIEHAGTTLNYEKDEGKDEDILAGMFVAVQEFVKDSFGGEDDEHLKRLDYGDKKVLVHRGKYVLLAAFLSGPVIKPYDRKMKDFVEDIEERFAGELENWTGSIEAFPDIRAVMESLLEGKYTKGNWGKAEQSE